MIHPVVQKVTNAIKARSEASRQAFERRIKQQNGQPSSRSTLSCGNLAHTVATTCGSERERILDLTKSNIGIISAYNDMVSAHFPYQYYPSIIKEELAKLGHTAQVAGCVPAMCDGITQGQTGMDLSLFSRDVIAQATAISLSHNAFDGTLLLGICDKIAPGQLMGALSHAHLPTAFVPAGPMATGLSNEEKVSARQKYTSGEIDKTEMLNVECRSYHSSGTCTFYGTANTNQLVFEAMGLMLPGSAFVSPHSSLREALTKEAARNISSQTKQSKQFKPLYQVLCAENLVNGVIALLASGGSTNHTIHMVAVARAAGLILTWDDIDQLSTVTPLLVNIYPNSSADINDFQAAGGVPTLLQALAQLNLLHQDITTSFGDFQSQLMMPSLKDGQLVWQQNCGSKNIDVLAEATTPFSTSGGIKVLKGNLGQAVIKISAIKAKHQFVQAPAVVFDSQHDVEAAYHRGELDKDCVVVVRFNGPAANGMPELHKLMPILGNIQNKGFQVALVTDGRLSGASGKIPAAIHVSPEAKMGGAIGRVVNGDIITVDCVTGSLTTSQTYPQITIDGDEALDSEQGWGRELFQVARNNVCGADQGATFLF
ncbi:phosphogluconate dehydratase [Vibrio panuliri]|uniref:Phosphogluconate dehydratase n=1 Tax=Vibrio panuliri TaxID=1381081 RepID=A0A1Q9HNT2_9VIBR|nr:phosphogluconate dehydratase [Vibrio panuliri]OLQ92476.1 phosphogluconate dehydratase [Vibrio panuliri]